MAHTASIGIAGVVGTLLLIVGFVVGAGGLVLLFTNPCPPTYHVSLQPVEAVADPPNETVSFASLDEHQRAAVTAALENRTERSFGSRDRLAALDDAVVSVDGDRYVADVVEEPCRTPYDDLSLGGFAGATVGFLLVLYAFLAWKLS